MHLFCRVVLGVRHFQCIGCVPNSVMCIVDLFRNIENILDIGHENKMYIHCVGSVGCPL